MKWIRFSDRLPETEQIIWCSTGREQKELSEGGRLFERKPMIIVNFGDGFVDYVDSGLSGVSYRMSVCDDLIWFPVPTEIEEPTT